MIPTPTTDALRANSALARSLAARARSRFVLSIVNGPPRTGRNQASCPYPHCIRLGRMATGDLPPRCWPIFRISATPPPGTVGSREEEVDLQRVEDGAEWVGVGQTFAVGAALIAAGK